MAKIPLTLLLIAALSVADVTFALDCRTVDIGGDVTQKVRVGTAVNIGIGAGACVRQSIGSIHGGVRTKGSVRQDVKVKNAVNIGVGLGIITVGGTCQEVGSMGDPC